MPGQTGRVVITGGGSAGWLTACIIAAEHSRAGGDLQVTVVESPDLPTIGVGEGTWPSMRSTLDNIGIEETRFLRATRSSFKQGTCFRGWRDGDDTYVHPFSLPQKYADLNLAPHWLADPGDTAFAQAVCPQGRLLQGHRAPKQITTPEYAFLVNYGYHLDAGRFAELLSAHAVTRLGVQHVKANVTGVNSSDHGDIASLRTDRAGDLGGDLFVDCSGASALLLSGHYKVPFISRRDRLFNDRALAAQLPYDREDAPIASATLSTALSTGWVWDIGLAHRRGVGYVYSSAHQSEDAATAELEAYLAAIGARPGTELRRIGFEPGYRREFWCRNCVAVGMSAGFIEPLEASALVMVELAASMIAEQLPATRTLMDIVARRFNDKFRYRWERILDFLKLHYVLSRRGEDYWRDHRAASSIPPSLEENLRLWRYLSPWHRDALHVDEIFPSASYQYILYGMGFRTERQTHRSITGKGALARDVIRRNAERQQKLASALPTNRELLLKVATHGFQKI